MPGIILPPTLDMDERVRLMQEDAALDIADGEAPGEGVFRPLARAGGARVSRSNPPKVPKVFVTNNCLFDCQYCGMRCSKEKRLRYVNKPRDVAEIAVKNAKSNGHGVFISSSIFRSPDYTEELIIETLRIIRTELYYRGYVHAKIMPGADPLLIERAGFLADRVSVNIELSHSDGYAAIAQQKTRQDILSPMAFIHQKINETKPARGKYQSKVFARSGQTTQVMAGAMGESDQTLITLAEALYKKYALRRVYYAAFSVPAHQPACLPAQPTPLWRTRRLYQADRLLQLYGFSASDLLSDSQPFLDRDVDPKAGWALRHLSLFPVEIQTADYEQLIRVPGLGVASANRIVNERRHQTLTHTDLRKMGVWMNRARFFITCGGQYDGRLLGTETDPCHWYNDSAVNTTVSTADYARADLYGSDTLRLLLQDGSGQLEIGDANGVMTGLGTGC